MNAANQISDDTRTTNFSGNDIPQLRRIRAALTSNTNLADWNTDYTSLTEYFDNTLRFIDFSLPCEGWYGYLALEVSQSHTPFTKELISTCEIEELNIQSSYDHEIKQINVTKLGEYLDLLNLEIPLIYSSRFYQNIEEGVSTLQTSFVKPLSGLTESELFYFLSIHKMLSHKYFPGINEIINS